MNNKQNFFRNVIFAVFFLLSIVWVGYLCFYRLGDAGIHNWDEARHIVNAIEMLKSGNGWIHTFLYETDYYNFKPPFSMWCISLAFRLLGINHFSMRIYSAVAMLLIYILLGLFVLKEFGRRAASIFCLVFSFNLDLFFFHMARTADADALYLLMIVIAMICLYETQKQPWFLAGTGFFLSMAFMAKCFHVATGIAIVICYLPVICKKCKLKHYVCAGVCGIIPIGIWATVRFLFDRFAFFAGMLGQEVIDRVEKENDYFAYIRYFADNPVVIVLLIVTAIAILLLFVSQLKQGKADEKKKWINRIIENKLYLFVVWFLIPLAVYSASGAFMEWYSYIYFIPLYVIASIVLGELTSKKGIYKWCSGLLLLALLVGFGINAKYAVWYLERVEDENNTDIRSDLSALIERYPEYRGSDIYIENSRNGYLVQNEWEQNCIAEAYIIGDMHPQNGGVPLFVEDRDAILIISKDLFASYSDTLAGRIILVDGDDYLIFNNDFYS